MKPKPWLDRGRYELAIIQRLGLGNDGANVLAAKPDWQVEALCHRQMQGTLSDDAVKELRLEYLKVRSAVPETPKSSQGST